MLALNRISIGPRLALGFALIVAIAMAVVAFGITRLSTLSDDLVLIGTDRVPKVKAMTDLEDDVNVIARELRNALIWDDAAKVNDAVTAVRAAREREGQTLARVEPSIQSAEGKRLLATLKKDRELFIPLQEEMVKLVQSGQREEARQLLTNRLRPVQLDYIKHIAEMTDYQIALVTKAAEDGQASYRQAKWLMLGLLGLIALVSAVLAVAITRSVTRPLDRAVRLAEAVASGDLGSRFEVTGRDETARLMSALARMNARLADVVSRVRANAEQIATGSSQVASGSTDLSQRTEEQAANVQQTAASMEQLNSTVKNNAENARAAAQLARGASAVASQGGTAVGQVVTTMQEISASSRRIAEIIGTIDGIAFQTNILALNAAVEAARAGEQGRGFAVVAGEVRTLAQRSAEAAREIKSLIGASVEKVAAGAQQVDSPGATMNDLVAQVQKVTDLISEISAASSEQTQGIGQVSDAIQQMDQVTQQNAALVEESAAAAESLKQQAVSLMESVSAFRLGAAR